MRVADRPLPTCRPHTDAALNRWPIRPVIAVQGRAPAAEYDDNPLEVYDDPYLEYDIDVVGAWTDATCEWQGLELTAGDPDDHFDFPAAGAVLQLSNSSGDWSRYNADGTQADHGPGFGLAVWALERDTGVTHWLFSGVISRWDDFTEGGVTVEAFDNLATLAQPIGTFTPGAAGQTPGPRLTAIAAAAGRAGIPQRFAAGTVTLTAQPTDAAPLDEMQAVAGSDAGALFGDADGTVVYLARSWRTGRTDQTVFAVASDNVCEAPVMVWNAVLSANDDALAQTVVLQNVAKLRAVAPAGAGTIAGTVFTETDHQWTTQIEGDTAAAVIYGAHGIAAVNVDEFELHLFDPNQPSLWQAVAWRLFDVLRFVHDTRATGGGYTRLDVNALLRSIAHDITPDGWIMTVATMKASSSNVIRTWNPPGDPYVWDTAGAVWGY